MNNSLYSISNELSELNQAISEVMESDNYTPEQKDELTAVIFANYLSVEERLDERLDWLGGEIKRLKAQADLCKTEAKRIATIGATYEAQAIRLRDSLLEAMQLHNKQGVNGTFCKLSIRKNALKLVIDVPVDELSDNLVTVETIVEKTPNKAAIKEYLANNGGSCFAHYEQTQSLVIK